MSSYECIYYLVSQYMLVYEMVEILVYTQFHIFSEPVNDYSQKHQNKVGPKSVLNTTYSTPTSLLRTGLGVF